MRPPVLGHDRPANAIILQSLTKTYAIAGLRPRHRPRRGGPHGALSPVCNRCGVSTPWHRRWAKPPWPTTTTANAAAPLSASNAKRWPRCWHNCRGVSVFPGRANFLLCRLDHPQFDAAQLTEQALQQGIALRACDNFAGLDARYFRGGPCAQPQSSNGSNRCSPAYSPRAGPSPENAKLRPSCSRAPAPMPARVSSPLPCAASSIRDGYDVAPFKAQNMSLNSFVTRDGGEMGRAQVMQAQACRLDPDVRMNPVLLKPNSDTGSQIICPRQGGRQQAFSRLWRTQARHLRTRSNAATTAWPPSIR